MAVYLWNLANELLFSKEDIYTTEDWVPPHEASGCVPGQDPGRWERGDECCENAAGRGNQLQAAPTSRAALLTDTPKCIFVHACVETGDPVQANSKENTAGSSAQCLISKDAPRMPRKAKRKQKFFPVPISDCWRHEGDAKVEKLQIWTKIIWKEKSPVTSMALWWGLQGADDQQR